MKRPEQLKKIYKEISVFMKAQKKAEKKGEYEFVCPLCGGKANWARSTHGHLWTICEECRFSVMED